MIKTNSIYTLNKKDPNAIVYPTADGKLIRVTCEDFPSEEAFLALKAWSDENFHEEEKLDHREANHVLPIDDLSEAALAVPAVDEEIELEMQIVENRRKASDMLVKLKDKLTETQFRRLWMHRVERKTLEEIAAIENVAFQSVHESIESANKKISKIF